MAQPSAADNPPPGDPTLADISNAISQHHP
jgi:hypothetical protein